MIRIELLSLLLQMTFLICAVALPDVVKIGKKLEMIYDCGSFKGVFKSH